MDTLFHFIFPIIIALAAKVHVNHKIRDILIAGAIAILIDSDHFIGLERATFHNVFITVIIPILFVLTAFSIKTKINLKGFSILLLLFLSSHLFLDIFSEGPVAIFYPFSKDYYSANFNIAIPIRSAFSQGYIEVNVVSTLGFGLLIYFVIIFLPCLFLDDIIELMEKRHESFKKALKDASK